MRDPPLLLGFLYPSFLLFNTDVNKLIIRRLTQNIFFWVSIIDLTKNSFFSVIFCVKKLFLILIIVGRVGSGTVNSGYGYEDPDP